jgi:hypothetical protein
MIAIGIETLEAVEFVDGIDEAIPYELVGEEPSPTIEIGNSVYSTCSLPFEEDP